MRDSAGRCRAALALALDVVFPRHCLGCARRLASGPAPLLLCPVCRGALERVDPRASCATCARPLPRGRLERPRCLDCRRDPPPHARLTAVWRYRPPLDRVVRALKFGRLDFLAAELVAEALAGRSGPDAPDVLVPVPLALPRRLARGFNQAERIASALAARLDAPCRALLVRPGWRSVPQRRLGRRERRANAAVRFEPVRRSEPVAGSILLVDDVFTTGSTLRAAGSALRRAGGDALDGLEAWVLAATPPASPPAARSGAAPGPSRLA
jgi:ComF family protein